MPHRPEPAAPALVAREAELLAVDAALAAARAEGAPRALLFWGPAGSGRTRLLDACAGLAEHAGVRALAAACTLGADRPFGPFIRLFQAWLPAVREVAAAAPPERRAALARLVPALGPGGETQLEPKEAMAAAQAAVCEVLRVLVADGAILTLDDWDTADVASVGALAQFLRTPGALPVAIVATAREPGALPPAADHALIPLDEAAIEALAAGMLDGDALPPALPGALRRWTGGWPGPVRQVIAHLRRVGALARVDDRWTLDEALDAAELAPAFLAEALTPLATLGRPARDVAELVAVLDADADREALAGLSGLAPAALDEAWTALVDRGILAPGERPRFTSGVMRQAAYGLAGAGRRLWLHALVAMRLEAAIADGTRADADARIALARHLAASRQTKKALPAAIAAATDIMARGEVDAARALLREALVPPVHGAGPDDGPRLDALAWLATIERWRGDFEAMGEVLDQAEPLALRAADDATRLRLLVLRAAWHNQRMTPGALDESIALLARALALPVEDPVWQSRARYFLAQAYFYLGQRAAAAFAFEAAAEGAARDGQPFWRAKSLAFLGYIAAKGEARDEGFARLSEAASIQAVLGDRYGRCFTLALLGDALMGALQLDEAERVFLDQLAVVEELGIGEDHVTCLTNLATVHALQGRFRDAAAICDRALPLATARGQSVGLLLQAVGGYALIAAGRAAEGADMLVAAEAAGGDGGYMWLHALPFLVEGWRWLGRADEMGRLITETRASLPVNADAELRAQIAALEDDARLWLRQPPTHMLDAGPAPSLARVLTLRTLARLELGHGRVPEARRAARALLALAEACGARAYAAEAHALLGRIALAAGPPGEADDARRSFAALRRYAGEEGVPILDAFGLLGEAAADPAAAAEKQAEARALLLGVAEGLEPATRRSLLANPGVAGLDALPAVPAVPAREEPRDLSGRIELAIETMADLARAAGAQERAIAAAERCLAVIEAVSAALAGASGPVDACERVLRVALAETGAERAQWLVADGDGFRPIAAVAPEGAARPGFVPAIAARAVRTPVGRLEGLGGDPDAELDLRGVLAVPMPLGGWPGALYLDAPTPSMAFGPDDMAALEAIARHAAAALALPLRMAEGHQDQR